MLRIFTLLCVLSLGGGCATIINGTTQKLPITSDPNGATVQIDGERSMTTPCTVELSRKRDHQLTFSKKGYESTSVTVSRSMSGAVAGNILAGGLIGWGVDATSGGQNKLVPSTVAVTMNKVEGDPPPATGLAARLSELQALHAQGIISDDEHAAMRKDVLNVR